MKFRLLENLLTIYNEHFLYVNPSTKDLRSKEDTKWNRGIIDAEGNLYIEAQWVDNNDYEDSLGDYMYSGWTHQDLLSALKQSNKFTDVNGWWLYKNFLNKGVFVQRYMDTLDFYLAESYEIKFTTKDKEKIKRIFTLCKKKNPYLTFHTEKINALGYGGYVGD